jgi:transcriptional regulator with XRE-family HTH domain
MAVLIRNARQASGKKVEECATAMSIPPAQFQAYENGEVAPSLPELELLAYFLDTPLDHFLGRGTIAEPLKLEKPFEGVKLIKLRQRAIGVLIRQARSEAGLTVDELAKRTSIPVEKIKGYELGDVPIPIPELEAIIQTVNRPLKDFQDHHGPIGAWVARRNAMKGFLEMPTDLQAFVSKPVNWPYLALARRLSDMSTDKLREVAEGLLEITL